MVLSDFEIKENGEYSPKHATIVGKGNYAGEIIFEYKSLNFRELTEDLHLESFTIDKDDNIYVGNGEGTLYKRINPEEFIPILATPSGPINCLAIDKNNNILAGSSNGVIYKTDGIKPFAIMAKIEVKNSSRKLGISKLAIDNYGNIYAGCNDGVYKSDGTSSFFEIPGINIVNTYEYGNVITSLVIDKKNNIYAASNNYENRYQGFI